MKKFFRLLNQWNDDSCRSAADGMRGDRRHVDHRGDLDLVSSTDAIGVGTVLTANLADQDGVARAQFIWKVRGDDGGWTRLETAGNTLTIDEALAGQEIKVVARYVDGDGHLARLVERAVVTEAPAPDDGQGSEGPDTGSGSGSGGPATPPTDPVTPPTDPTTGSGSGGGTGGSGTGTGGTPPTDPGTGSGGTPPADGDQFAVGINLAGAEFGSRVPGTFGTDYTYPTTENIDYYADKGLESIRLPFLWERIQSEKNGPLNAAELARMDAVVEHATSRGLEVDLDMHNYGYGFGARIGSSGTPNSAFADVWGKLAAHYKDNPNVHFGIMNEPHDQPATEWLQSANAAIDAIRDAGATQKINVPGTYWTGAHSWVSTDNDTVIGGGIRDPLDNYRFEVHQYLDQDSSGTRAGVVSADIGVERLAAITDWAEKGGHKLYLGEFGVARDAQSLAALDNMMEYMQQHQNVWEGAAYWAGGPWWGDYMFSAEPTNGNDKPQLEILTQYA